MLLVKGTSPRKSHTQVCSIGLVAVFKLIEEKYYSSMRDVSISLGQVVSCCLLGPMFQPSEELSSQLAKQKSFLWELLSLSDLRSPTKVDCESSKIQKR